MIITPSPCLMASSQTTVSKAIELLIENKSSYLLLINDDNVLTGIFTKTDLLKITPQLFTNPSLGSRPIHLVMNKPVKSIQLELIHTAPEFMLKHCFEHVPVTEYDENTKTDQVIGILTSESIFEFMVKLRGIPPIFGGETVRRTRKVIGVMGADGGLFRLMKSIFSRSFYVDVERFMFSNFELENVASSVDALLVDIDNTENRVWIPLIKDVVKHSGLETVFVAYTPSLHQDFLPILKKIEVYGVFKLYEKPIDASLVTVDLEKIWAGLNL